jgi:tetratricopeptide (TPR) repeat protein
MKLMPHSPKPQHWLCWSLLVSLWLSPVASLAQDPEPRDNPSSQRAAHGDLVERGLAAFSAGRVTEAREIFEQAHALAPSARTLRVLGITALALDQYAQARDELKASLEHPKLPLTAAQRSEVDKLLEWIRTNLGSVRVESTPAHAEAKVDGKVLEKPEMLLEPAEHQLVVSAEGFETHTEHFQLSIMQQLSLHVALIAKPEAAITTHAATAHAPDLATQQLTAAAPSAHVTASSAPLWPWLGGGGLLLMAAGGTMLGFGLHDVATVEHARDVPLSAIQGAHDRAPWLTGGGVALAAIGITTLAVGVLIAPR